MVIAWLISLRQRNVLCEVVNFPKSFHISPFVKTATTWFLRSNITAVFFYPFVEYFKLLSDQCQRRKVYTVELTKSYSNMVKSVCLLEDFRDKKWKLALPTFITKRYVSVIYVYEEYPTQEL